MLSEDSYEKPTERHIENNRGVWLRKEMIREGTR